MDALLAAVSRGDSPAALQLIKKRAFNSQAVDADGRNALQLACYSNMTDVANKLIDSGKFALNAVDPDGSSLIMIACMNRMEQTALKLVPANDTGHLDATGNTALMVACGANLPAVAIALLKRTRQIGLNVVNKNGVNALLIAAGKKLADVCLMLIDLGADVSLVSAGGGNTAFILAAKGGLGMDAVVTKLLDKGADASVVNGLGESALFWSATTNTNAHNIKRLITPQTINRAQTSTGNTPLIAACLSLNTDAAMTILASPAVDVAVVNKRKQTAETIAVEQGQRPVVERLIRGTTVAINADKTVSDFVNQEDVNIRAYLAASNDHIIFALMENHVFASSRSAILRDFDSKVRYRCKETDTMRPENIDLSLPLYAMRQIGVMVDFCLADDMRAVAADVGHQVYTLKKVTGRPVVSVVSHDVLKNNGSVVGAAHCQSGQGGFYYLVVKAETIDAPDSQNQGQGQKPITPRPTVLNSVQLQLKGQRITFSTRVDTTVGDLKTMAERRLDIQSPILVYGGKKLVDDDVLIRQLPNYIDGMVINVMGQSVAPSMAKTGGKRRL